LELINEPTQLGEQSPLAAPYLLGAALNKVEPSAYGRGQALAALIARAAANLWNGPLPADTQELFSAAMNETPAAGRYDYLILELNYFKQHFRPAPLNQVEIYTDILHISRPTHDRHLRAALERLASALLGQLRPAIYLEQPLPPSRLIGRAELLAQLATDLRAAKSVTLIGRGGAGKSALAAALAQRWPAEGRFWFTFRPALNDQLESLLFALGHFLHGVGASALWQQLIVAQGRPLDGALVLGLALADLHALAQPPLLCFDDLDVLYATHEGQAQDKYLPLLAFLDGLRGHGPLLLIGQRATWASDTIYEVEELSVPQLASWLDALDIPYTAADLDGLHAYTAGNPRLAELCVALLSAARHDTLTATLERLPRAPALLPLWRSLAARLPVIERSLLEQLAVFRSLAPADVWLAKQAADNAPSGERASALHQLIDRRLVQHDGRGGVALLPALRVVVYENCTPERREELHIQAAQIRAERGAYTAAAYHLQRAGQYEAAVELWYVQREHEINQGQLAAARAIFAEISPRWLSPSTRKLLLLLRADLHERIGEPARAEADLSEAEWPADDRVTPEAMLMLGRAIEAQGDRERALSIYQVGLDSASTLLRLETQIHVQRSLTRLRQREMQHAWHEARLAQFHAVTMLGIVSDQSGDYATAREHYSAALAVAEQLGYEAGIAQTHHYLAMLAGRRQDVQQALVHFEQAISFYERVGDRLNREYVRGNLASMYIQARQFAAALEPAAEALAFFAAMGNTFRVAQNASNLAEAHAELGNLNQAEHYARIVLRQEEPQSHPYALYTLGTVYLRRGKLAEAERYYKQARQLAESNDDSYLLAFAWRALGEVFRAQRQPAQAAFAHAIALFRQLNIEDEARRTEDIAADA
jgi:tetratricopeptide (TPR) repeat protein